MPSQTLRGRWRYVRLRGGEHTGGRARGWRAKGCRRGDVQVVEHPRGLRAHTVRR